MSNARRMTAEEILSLPLGAVVWYEEHASYDDPDREIYWIPYYCVFPVMVSKEGEDFTLIGSSEPSAPMCWNAGAIPYMRIWDSKPDLKQLPDSMSEQELNAATVEALQEMSDKPKSGYDGLKRRILWEYESLRAFADRIGMSVNTLSRKLTRKSSFKASEIETIVGALYLDHEGLMQYFFADYKQPETIS